MADLPTGTLTFLFTDIEGSTRLWETQRAEMQTALSRHDALLRHAVIAHRGHVLKTGGDAFYAAFPTASDAVAAALECGFNRSMQHTMA
jgi:class 3 adenylate cyclase